MNGISRRAVQQCKAAGMTELEGPLAVDQVGSSHKFLSPPIDESLGALRIGYDRPQPLEEDRPVVSFTCSSYPFSVRLRAFHAVCVRTSRGHEVEHPS